jgi:small GTP-binding protein
VAIKKKIVLLGDSAVGKTSLIRRYVFDQFEDSYISTIGSKVTRKEFRLFVKKQPKDIVFMIWDLIGREGYHALHSRTFVGVHGAILVADMTREDTLTTLEKYWIPFLYKVVEFVPLVFVCNKLDLKSEVQFDLKELSEVASRYNVNVEEVLPKDHSTSYSTSAKTGDNVERAFETMGHLVLSSDEMIDPVKEVYEGLVATGVKRSADTSTAVGAMDVIITDFCDGFDDPRLAMLILRQEVARASMDINNPTKEQVLRVVEYLAESENEYKNDEDVKKNLMRRLKWADRIN